MKQDTNFIQVNNDLLASTALSSTQKLFISFVIGWQKNNLVCRMTNNSLATHFGMKYAGIRTLLNALNKMPFFETTQYGSTKKGSGWSSGHELRVNEEELKKFLDGEIKIDRRKNIQELTDAELFNLINEANEIYRPIAQKLKVDDYEDQILISKELQELVQKNDLTEEDKKRIRILFENDFLETLDGFDELQKLAETKLNNSHSKALLEEEQQNPKLEELTPLPKYNDDDLVEIYEIMPLLGYETKDIQLFIEYVKENPTDYVEKNSLPTGFFISRIPFVDFFNHFTKLFTQQKYNDYNNIKITQKEMDLLEKMIG